MSTTDCAATVALPDLSVTERPTNDGADLDFRDAAPGRTSKLLMGLLISFAGTVTIGFGLTAWYVGNRMVAVSARNESPSPRTAFPIRAQQSAAGLAPVAMSGAPESPIADSNWHTVPPAGIYLQVAGLGPKQDADFAESLQAQGFRAQMQMRDGAVTRVLIGPFSTPAQLEEEKHKLLLGGVLAVETAY